MLLDGCTVSPGQILRVNLWLTLRLAKVDERDSGTRAPHNLVTLAKDEYV
jgi:hypothetical protein